MKVKKINKSVVCLMVGCTVVAGVVGMKSILFPSVSAADVTPTTSKGDNKGISISTQVTATVATCEVTDSTHVTFTMSDGDTHEHVMTKAFEPNVETNVEFTYKGKSISYPVTYSVKPATLNEVKTPSKFVQKRSSASMTQKKSFLT